MKRQVFRNELLKGVISKERALKLLDVERRTRTKVRRYEIEIFRDDNEDINIDMINSDGEVVGGSFDCLGYID